jgi:signal transduction histidine kinase
MNFGKNHLERWPRAFAAPLSILIVTVVGLVDYLTGYETFFFIFYLVAVFLATWYVSMGFGALVAALSVTAWVSSNIGAGARYSSYFVPAWNALIMFACYLVVVRLLARLKKFNHELEQRVELRTQSLASEVRRRMRLQKEILETSERERQRLGHELHDGLGQHLTGTALAGQIVTQKISAGTLPDPAEAERLVRLIEESIELTRRLARSLSPVELKPGRVRENFQELAGQSAARFGITCRFECDAATPLPEPSVALHLYHIAAEAIANAVRHGHAREVNLGLEADERELSLTITDDGSGLPGNFRETSGMGARVMAYRSDLIGGKLEMDRLPTRGTRVTCTLPLVSAAKSDDE